MGGRRWRRARRRPRSGPVRHPVRAGRQHRPRDAAVTQRRQRRLRGTATVDDDRRHPGAGRRLERGLPAVVDLDEVDQRADHAVDLSQQLPPAGALQLGERTLQRLGPGMAAVAGVGRLVGRGLRGLGGPGGLLQLLGRGRQRGIERGGGAVELFGLAHEEVGAHGGTGLALLERRHALAEAVEVLLLPGGGPGDELAPGHACAPWPVRGRARRPTRRPTARAARRPRRRAPPARRPARRARARRRRSSSASAAVQLAGEPGGFRFQRGDDVDVGRGVQRREHGTAPLAQHALHATGPLDQSLDTPERVRQVLLPARRELGRRRRRLGVETLECGVQLALLVAAHGEVLGGGEAAGRQLGHLRAGQVPAHRQQLGGDGIVRAGGGGLALQGTDLAPDLAHQVPSRSRFSAVAARRRSARSRRRRCFNTPAASSMMARRSSGRAFNTVSSWPWPMIMCCWRPTPESLNSSWMSSSRHGAPLMAYSESPAAEQGPGDGDLGEVDGELARGVVDGQRHLGPPQLGPRRGPRKDDVLHFRRPQRARPLRPQDPGDGVDDVGLSAPVRPDDDGDPGLELQHRGVGEGLEPLHAEGLQEHSERPYRVTTGRLGEAPPDPPSRRPYTWQCSQKNVERPPVFTRTIELRQRRHGWPSRS